MTDRPPPPDLRDALDERPDADALARVWGALDGADPDPLPPGVPSDAHAWAALQGRLRTSEAPGAPRAARRAPDRLAVAAGRRRGRRARTAAFVAAAVGALAVTGLWALSQPVTERAGTAETALVALPDGSRVELAADTEIRYDRGFRTLLGGEAEVRAVALSGEAFFDVERGARPFVVETHDARMTVLGTRFNVRARATDRASETRVVLEEGRVRVAGDAGAVVLAPGEAATVAGGAVPVAVPASAERATAWQRGGFAVEDRPLGDVLAEVERQFGVVAGAAEGVPLDVPMTLYYGSGAEAEAVVHDLALAAGLRYRPVQGGFELVPAE